MSYSIKCTLAQCLLVLVLWQFLSLKVLARYFDLIDLKVKNADSHKIIETNGKEHL